MERCFLAFLGLPMPKGRISSIEENGTQEESLKDFLEYC